MSVYHEFTIKIESNNSFASPIARFTKSDSGNIEAEFEDGALDRQEWRDLMDGLRQAGAQLGWYD